jgi:hypothetical protein
MPLISGGCFGRRRFTTGLVILGPNAPPAIQHAQLEIVLDYIGDRDLVNRAVEVSLTGDEAEIEEYEIPLVDATNG